MTTAFISFRTVNGVYVPQVAFYYMSALKTGVKGDQPNV